ncbi:Multidrug resistance protein MdtC [Poriferisphaera corsica]|uniref:Multidrug resistance protein MdtC n=1 Tax=Poriferisphaera corsica TaxID=2528020 RepID=A0A517YS01_9BACT|nr:efflux RND transporter permease subunit [Poriferisphaera corsica]QDU32999.1 Multidrug resistance protein MdtC [Poriferisphaera corsica]
MDFIGFAIKNPVKVAVGVLLILLFGVLSLLSIPIQLTPDVDTPQITVTTSWVGRSPEEIEKEIIDRQEDKLKGVSNLRKMKALAQTGTSQVTLEFYVGTNIDVARNEVSDKLREVPDYPDGVDEPVISSTEQGGQDAIAWIVLTSEDPNFDVEGFYDTVDDRVKPLIERVEGVDELQIYGGREREVHVEINPILMAQRGVTFNSLINALRGENVNVSAGDFNEGRLDVRIRTIGQYETLENIRETIVSTDASGPVRVKDIGDAKLSLDKRRAFVHQRGMNALAMAVNKQSGANVVQVQNRLDNVIKDINENVLPTLAKGTSLKQVYNQTIYINDAVQMVQTNLVIGAILAGVVLLVFLRTVRPTMIVLLSIPISVIGTFVVMTMLGRSINVISLAGLAFAVGMVVDAAIVVLENIDRHLGMGKSTFAAAYDGTVEVWGAILASVLTTVAVFVPVIFMQEEAGQLFRDISIAICASVLLSLLVSITVIPVASARMLKMKKEIHESAFMHQLHTLFGIANIAAKFTKWYSDSLYWVVAKMPARFIMRIVIVSLFTLISVIGAYMLMPPSSYLPSGNNNFVFGILLNPPGYSIPFQEEMAKEIEDSVRPYWEAETYADLEGLPPFLDPFTGQPVENIPPVENFFDVAYPGGMIMGASSKDKNNVMPLANLITARMWQIPGSMGFGFQMPIFGDATSSSDSIDVEIISDDLEDLKKVGAAMEQAMRAEFGNFTPIQPDPRNYKLPGPEMQLSIKRVHAADMGIDVNSVGVAVQSLIDGAVIGDYRLEGDTVDLKLIRAPEVEITLDQIGGVPLAVPSFENPGQMDVVPLASVVDVKRTQAPQEIKRIERRRAVSLSVTMPPGLALETAIQKVDQMQQGILARMKGNGEIGSNVIVQIAGSADKLSAVRTSLLGDFSGSISDILISVISSRMFLALLVTYLLMAALFESFLYPAVIMFSVPLATIGGFIGLFIVHKIDPTQQLDVLTMLGFVILIGIVVNNAILIVHQSLNFMKGIGESTADKVEQLDPYNAIRESVRTRMRPIFMTTATSVFGMLPLVIAGGAGSELYKGLGSVVVGGLVVATLFTLIVVPILFSLIVDMKAYFYKVFGWQMAETMDADKAEHLLEA